jgi:hypothetical protein
MRDAERAKSLEAIPLVTREMVLDDWPAMEGTAR